MGEQERGAGNQGEIRRGRTGEGSRRGRAEEGEKGVEQGRGGEQEGAEEGEPWKGSTRLNYSTSQSIITLIENISSALDTVKIFVVFLLTIVRHLT